MCSAFLAAMTCRPLHQSVPIPAKLVVVVGSVPAPPRCARLLAAHGCCGKPRSQSRRGPQRPPLRRLRMHCHSRAIVCSFAYEPLLLACRTDATLTPSVLAVQFVFVSSGSMAVMLANLLPLTKHQCSQSCLQSLLWRGLRFSPATVHSPSGQCTHYKRH